MVSAFEIAFFVVLVGIVVPPVLGMVVLLGTATWATMLVNTGHLPVFVIHAHIVAIAILLIRDGRIPYLLLYVFGFILGFVLGFLGVAGNSSTETLSQTGDTQGRPQRASTTGERQIPATSEPGEPIPEPVHDHEIWPPEDAFHDD